MRDGRRRTAWTSRSATALARLQEHAGKTPGRPRRPAARLRALRRARVDARDAGHRPEPRASTTGRSRAWPRDRQRALRLGLLPPLRADVRQRRARRRGRALRGRDQARQARARRPARHRARRRRAARADARVQGLLRLPAGPAGAARARRSAPSSTPGWATARSTTAASTASPTTGAPRSTSSRWCSATRATTSRLGRRVQSRRGHRRARALRRLPANAQGEDVVSGVRNTRDIAELRDWHARGPRAADGDPAHARGATTSDMQDSEFTVEEGRLYMLQTRSAKRPAQAAVRFAVDAVDEGLLTREQAMRRSTPRSSTRCCTRPSTRTPTTRCSPGRRRLARRREGRDRLHAPTRRSRRRRRGSDVILVRPFTEADDVAGFHAAKGILTSEGGKASHAALVARGMGRAGGDGRRRRSRSTCQRAGARGRHGAARAATTSRSTARRERSRRRRPARRARARASTSRRSSPGPTSCAGSACARTPTRPTMRARRASSAPRASACAAPSTCSSARTASRRWSDVILADDEEGRRAALDRAAAAPAGGLRGPVRGDGRACR